MKQAHNSDEYNGFSARPAAMEEALGQSDAFLYFQESLSRAAGVDRSLLLIGERGTGKELAARRVHFLSRRWQGSFVTLNCAALSPTLIEAELFGHERGAFTGAERLRTGRFEAADGGTLFLDEIGNIPIEAQEKILRVVEYGCFERLGSSRSIEVDVRIVGATNAHLPGMAETGKFKADLLDRLSFEVLFLPPLRYREGDILLLANHFAGRMAYELGREQVHEFNEKAKQMLENYSWPGNIRELKNVVERAVYRSETGDIENIVFDPFVSPFEPAGSDIATEPDTPRQVDTQPPPVATSMKQAVQNLELMLLRDALEKKRYNQKDAAQALGLSYDQLRGLIRKYGKTAVGLA